MSAGDFPNEVPTYHTSRRVVTEQQVHLVVGEDVTFAHLRLLIATAESHHLPDDSLFALQPGDCVTTLSLSSRITDIDDGRVHAIAAVSS